MDERRRPLGRPGGPPLPRDGLAAPRVADAAAAGGPLIDLNFAPFWTCVIAAGLHPAATRS